MALTAGSQLSGTGSRGKNVFMSWDFPLIHRISDHINTHLLCLPEGSTFTSASGQLFQMPSGPETPGWEKQRNASPSLADEQTHNEPAVYFSLRSPSRHEQSSGISSCADTNVSSL